MSEPRSWAELAMEALQVQHATALSEVLDSFQRVLKEVRARLEIESGRDFCRYHNHPIVVLYVKKLASMTDVDNYFDNDIYNACADMTEKKK